MATELLQLIDLSDKMGWIERQFQNRENSIRSFEI